MLNTRIIMIAAAIIGIAAGSAALANKAQVQIGPGGNPIPTCPYTACTN